MQDTEEVWEIIPLPQLKSIYSISNRGRVKNNKSGRILKPYYDRRGYNRLTLSVDAVVFKFFAHRLVLISFGVPNPENKCDVNHINGNASDNRLINLEWATRKENIHHAFRTGLWSSKVDRYVLDEKLVKEIRGKYIPGKSGSVAKISREYNLKRKHVEKIVYREIWKYV